MFAAVERLESHQALAVFSPLVIAVWALAMVPIAITVAKAKKAKTSSSLI